MLIVGCDLVGPKKVIFIDKTRTTQNVTAHAQRYFLEFCLSRDSIYCLVNRDLNCSHYRESPILSDEEKKHFGSQNSEPTKQTSHWFESRLGIV